MSDKYEPYCPVEDPLQMQSEKSYSFFPGVVSVPRKLKEKKWFIHN